MRRVKSALAGLAIIAALAASHGWPANAAPAPKTAAVTGACGSSGNDRTSWLPPGRSYGRGGFLLLEYGGQACLKFQTDGNLVAYRWNGSVIWSANTYDHTAVGFPPHYLQGYVLRLQGDGNVVVYNQWNVALWAVGAAADKGAGINNLDHFEFAIGQANNYSCHFAVAQYAYNAPGQYWDQRFAYSVCG